MNRLFIYIVIMLVLTACKKDKNPASLGGGICSNYVYDQKTSSNFDTIKSNLLSNSAIGSSFFRQDPILFTSPCFNPNDPFEICYIKNQNNSSTGQELWKYNFCKGAKTKLASNIFYSLDWSSKNWLIYTGFDQHVYKIKSNGDSLTKLTTTGGIHAVGKWSPDGTKFWYLDGSITYYICNHTGSVLSTFQSSINPVDWIDDNNLLIESGQKFCSYDYTANKISMPLHPRTFYLYGFHAFNKINETCLVTSNNGQNPSPKHLLRYNFTDGTVDTLKEEFFSHSYKPGGDLSRDGNRLIAGLYRAKWLDFSNDMIQYRSNIIIMNADGNNERLLDLN